MIVQVSEDQWVNPDRVLSVQREGYNNSGERDKRIVINVIDAPNGMVVSGGGTPAQLEMVVQSINQGKNPAWKPGQSQL